MSNAQQTNRHFMCVRFLFHHIHYRTIEPSILLIYLYILIQIYIHTGDSSGQSEPLLSSFDDPVTAVSISLQHGYHLVREEDEHNLINDVGSTDAGGRRGADASTTTVLYDYDDDEVKFHLNNTGCVR